MSNLSSIFRIVKKTKISKNICYLWCFCCLGSQNISRHQTLARISTTRDEEDESYQNTIMLMIASSCGLLVFGALEMGFYYLFNYKVRFGWINIYIAFKWLFLVPSMERSCSRQSGSLCWKFEQFEGYPENWGGRWQLLQKMLLNENETMIDCWKNAVKMMDRIGTILSCHCH